MNFSCLQYGVFACIQPHIFKACLHCSHTSFRGCIILHCTVLYFSLTVAYPRGWGQGLLLLSSGLKEKLQYYNPSRWETDGGL